MSNVILSWIGDILRFPREEVGAVEAPVKELQMGQLERAPGRAVVMLDIDGVLHPYQSGSLALLPRFEDWLESVPDVDVIISSSWRESHSLSQLKRYFREPLRNRIIGTTPLFYGESRLSEILYMVRLYQISCWAAIDDDGREFNNDNHLVLTQTAEGLTESHIEQLSALLRS